MRQRLTIYLLLLVCSLLGPIIAGSQNAWSQSIPGLYEEAESSQLSQINPASLSANWYSALSTLDIGKAGDEIKGLITALKNRIETVADEEIRKQLDQDLSDLNENLQTWLDLRKQLAIPFTVTEDLQPPENLSRYLQIGGERIEKEQEILEFQNQNTRLQTEISTLENRLASLAINYRSTPSDSARRYLLGMQRINTRVQLQSLQLRVELNQQAIDKTKSQLDKLNGLIFAAKDKLEPDAEDDIEIEHCNDIPKADQFVNRAAIELIELRNAACTALQAQVDIWKTLGGEDPPPDTLDDLENLRTSIVHTNTTLPELRSQIEQGILTAAQSSSNQSQMAKLTQALEQWLIAKQHASQSTLLLELLDAQQLRTGSEFSRIWYYIEQGFETAWAKVKGAMSVKIFAVGDSIVTPWSLLKVILIVWFGWMASKLFRHAIERLSRRRFAGGDSAAWYTLSRIGHYIIIIAATLIGLASIGLDLSNLAIIAGALSVGIGFGLQSIVSNFVSGLILLFERSIKVGDYVDLENGTTGQVRAISTRFTRINTNDNIDILVPNSELVSNRLINWTMFEAMRRLHVPFGVAYGTDKELVKKAALEAADNVEFTIKHLPNRKPEVWLVEFGDSSVNYELLVWLSDGVKRPSRVRAAYLWELETTLSKYNIEIPFPQRDLHIRSGLHQPTVSVEDDEKKAE